MKDQIVSHGTKNALFQDPLAEFQFPQSLEQEFEQDPELAADPDLKRLERLLRVRHLIPGLGGDTPGSSLSCCLLFSE